MTIASYSDLQTSMGRFLKRPDLISLFPDFIMLAEQRFNRVITTRGRRSRFAISPSIHEVNLPTDWGRVLSVQYAGRTLEFFPASTDHHHIADGYRILGDNLVLTVGALGHRLEVHYLVDIEPLSTTNPSNWLLQDAPDIYLAGALYEGFSYIRDAAMTPFWQGKRDATIQDFIDDDAQAKLPEDQPLVMRRG